jgi:hypothetical protein
VVGVNAWSYRRWNFPFAEIHKRAIGLQRRNRVFNLIAEDFLTRAYPSRATCPPTPRQPGAHPEVTTSTDQT